MQREFFVMATGGPLEYSGRPLAHSHHGRGITRHHFASFTGNSASFRRCPRVPDEWWAWMNMDYHRKPPWTGSVFMGNFMDEVDGSYAQMVSPRVKYAALPWLDLGLGLSMLRLENIATHDRYDQLRPELEINPHHEPTKQVRLDWRNLIEWRENQGASPTTNRTRHRLQLAWTLPRPLGLLTRIFTNDEWLMDMHLRRPTENRFVPLGLTFKLTDSMDLDVFYMIGSKRTKTTWKQESVLGTYLRVRF